MKRIRCIFFISNRISILNEFDRINPSYLNELHGLMGLARGQGPSYLDLSDRRFWSGPIKCLSEHSWCRSKTDVIAIGHVYMVHLTGDCRSRLLFLIFPVFHVLLVC